MSKRQVFAWTLASASCVVVGCRNQGQAEQAAPRESGAQTASAGPSHATGALVDQWLGKWVGPEGTYLELPKNENKYVVKINSLDGPATYEGIAVADHDRIPARWKEQIHSCGRWSRHRHEMAIG